MYIGVSDTVYDTSPSFMTLLKYRVETGKSFLNEKAELDAQIKLLYISIIGEKPHLHVFNNQCIADKNFNLTFTQFCSLLLQTDKTYIPENLGENGGTSDELDVVALAVNCGISENLFNILTLFQLVAVIHKCCGAKTGKQQSHEMSSNERKALYGISKETEDSIARHLASLPS